MNFRHPFHSRGCLKSLQTKGCISHDTCLREPEYNYITEPFMLLQSNLPSRKPPPKMRRLIGRLRVVVAYESRIAGGFFLEEVRTHLL